MWQSSNLSYIVQCFMHTFFQKLFLQHVNAPFNSGAVDGVVMVGCLPWFDIKNQVHSYIIKIKVFIQFIICLIGISIFLNTYSTNRSVNHKHNVRAAKQDTHPQNRSRENFFDHFTVLPRNRCIPSVCQIDAQSPEGRTLSPIPLWDSYWWNHPSSSWSLKKDQKREIFKFLMQLLQHRYRPGNQMPRKSSVQFKIVKSL